MVFANGKIPFIDSTANRQNIYFFVTIFNLKRIICILTNTDIMKTILITILILLPLRLFAPVFAESNIKTNLTKTKFNIYHESEFNDYAKKLAYCESRNTWKIINRFGYMGLFQFGKSALKSIGIDSINAKRFKANPSIFPIELQYLALKRHLSINELILKKYIKKYQYTRVKGILITKSGILASAHLVGARKVKIFLTTGIDCMDGNKVKVSVYMKKFSGYDLKLN